MQYSFIRTILFIGLLLFYTSVNGQYCNPTFSSGCSSGDFMQSFSTTGGSTNITNNNTFCAFANGIAIYTSMIHTGIPGQNVNFSFTNNPTWSLGYKIWVDWNDNGILNDAGEEMYASATTIAPSTIINSSFMIPLTATNGPKRMRVMCVFATTAFDPCGSYTFGEIEDYTLQVNASCTGIPNSGIASANPTSVVCGGMVDLSLNGNTAGLGITYQWQRNTGSGWTNFGNSSPTTSTILTQTAQFRCQVTCTNTGGGTATTNPISVFVTPITVNIGNDTTLCPGITQTLDATNVAGSAYLWTPGNLTTPTRNINTAGEYRVRVTQPNGCIGRDTIMITNGLQPVNNLAPSYNLCADSTITLDAGNSTGCYFLWTPTSATTQTLTINNGGNYSVLITSVDNCELVSATNVVYRPRPVLMLPPISTICSTDSVLLDATTPLGFTYSWSTGATTPSIYAKDSIFYYVTVSSEYGCPSWDDTKVEFYPDPTTEGFTFIPYFYEQLGKVTFAPINPQAVTSYRWYFGDGDSSYQRTPTHVYKGSGIYLVTLVVVNHCTENTYTQNVHINLPTGIVTTDANMEVAVYPNPAKDKVTIENKSNRQLTTVQIYNATGAIVYQENIKSNTHEIPLNSMASGIYQIRIQAEDNNWMIKKLEILK